MAFSHVWHRLGLIGFWNLEGAGTTDIFAHLESFQTREMGSWCVLSQAWFWELVSTQSWLLNPEPPNSIFLRTSLVFSVHTHMFTLQVSFVVVLSVYSTLLHRARGCGLSFACPVTNCLLWETLDSSLRLAMFERGMAGLSSRAFAWHVQSPGFDPSTEGES